MPLHAADVVSDPRNYQVPHWADSFNDYQEFADVGQFSPEPRNYQVPHWSEYNFNDYQEFADIGQNSPAPRNYQVPHWADGFYEPIQNEEWLSVPEHGGGPFFDIGNAFPSPGAVNVPLTTSIVLPSGYWYTELDTRLLSFRGTSSYGPQNSGVDDSRTEIVIQYGTTLREPAYLAGSAVNGWAVSLTPSNVYGVIYEMAKSLPPLTTIFVEITLYDFYGRRYKSVFSFTTTASAKIYPVYPVPDQQGVRPDSLVIFSIAPAIFKEDSVVVEVDQGDEEGFVEVFNSGVPEKFLPGWDGPLSSEKTESGTYTVVLDPWNGLPKNKTVSVRISALDISETPLELG
jgi:hypothetical protein